MTLDSLAKNIPGLDGLRGLAVVAVILLHADVPGCAGGFIGVDVFFVLSGFLITGLLLRERVTSGRVKLSHFYMRRALRLLPALVGLVLALALVVFARAPASWRYPFFLDSLATLFYYQNLARGLGWLPPGLYAHLWSLSIEEHFYLVWPLILVALYAVGSRKRGVLIATVTLTTAATLWAAYNAGIRSWQHSYFLTDLRLGPLLAGALLATLAHADALSKLSKGSIPVRAGAIFGMGGLALGVWIADSHSPLYFRWGLPLIGLATNAVILELLLNPTGSIAKALGRSPLAWLGRRSYGIYLWHFPLLVPFANEGWPTKLLVSLGGSVLVAGISYRFLELPFLRLKKRFATRVPEVPQASDPGPGGESPAPTP